MQNMYVKPIESKIKHDKVHKTEADDEDKPKEELQRNIMKEQILAQTK